MDTTYSSICVEWADADKIEAMIERQQMRRYWLWGMVYFILMCCLGCVMSVNGGKAAPPTVSIGVQGHQGSRPVTTPAGEDQGRPAEGL